VSRRIKRHCVGVVPGVLKRYDKSASGSSTGCDLQRGGREDAGNGVPWADVLFEIYVQI
jgi:hypothetical protein